MKVLVGCEFSGVVRREFRKLGHDAWSCDLLPAKDRSKYHIQRDVLEVIGDGWDLGIFHPPCTHLAVSGARWFKEKRKEQKAALEFVQRLWDCKIPRKGLENPVSIISSYIGEPTQIIQPWMFGHGETKATCLWLKNLPKLVSTKVVAGREPRVWKLPPSKDRWMLRSLTYMGVAKAMAAQWSVPYLDMFGECGS